MSDNALKIMHLRIKKCLSDIFIRSSVHQDFSTTFQNIGVNRQEAEHITDRIFCALSKDKPIQRIEIGLYDLLSKTEIGDGNTKTLTSVIDEKLQGRAELIYGQISPHFNGITGKVLDFGAGDGQITQLLSNDGLNISGVDIRSYSTTNITVPIDVFDGFHVDAKDFEFEAGLATNVFHHETDNEQCLAELSRIVKSKLVIIETIPVGDTDKAIEIDRERTFMNDYLYNRLLHNPEFNIPVPGTYETTEGWVNRAKTYGWKQKHIQYLGNDIPVIADIHSLIVLER